MEIDEPFQKNNNNKNTIFKSVVINNSTDEKNINNNHIISDTSQSFFEKKDNSAQIIDKINTNNPQINNNNFIDEISIISKTSSYYKRAVNLINIKKSADENNEEIKEIKETNKDCLICYEKLTFEELQNNFIGCFHGFCDDCLYNYFKEKINKNETEKIKCPQHDCDQLIFNNFIEMKIINDVNLLEKFIKITKRRQLMKDPNVKLCPFPDCESYAYQNEHTNNVTCIENQHKFCFNCLEKWHDGSPCKTEPDSLFKKWKKSNNIKRCPNCKVYIEKLDGCNHITCRYCNYEWCWLCGNKYNYQHYTDISSPCYGLQYVNNNCCSNRFCRIISKIGLIILKVLAVIFLVPGYVIFLICEKIFRFLKIYDRYYEKKYIAYILTLSLLYICFLITLMALYICILLLLLIFYLPKKK